jgi:hypothetical protein
MNGKTTIPMRYLLILFAVIGSLHLRAQVPQAIDFQGIARDASGNVLSGQSLTVRISILSGAPNGPVVYQEDHSVTTSPLGLFTLTVGEGTPTLGAFISIGWANTEHYMNVAMAVPGGNGLMDMGTSRFVTVPYALVAGTSLDCFSVSQTGDTLFQGNGCWVIIPGISAANSGCNDLDGDGYFNEMDCPGDLDCDDGDVAINPGAVEVCDNIDNDCDGDVDEGFDLQNSNNDCGSCGNVCPSGTICVNGVCTSNCPDADADSFTICDGDCDDGQPSIYPGAPEVPGNNIDEDCDGSVDECDDSDGDGWTSCTGDCNDADPLVNPGAFDIAGNSVDDDCNGTVDDAAAATCSATPKFSAVTGMDMAQAMGLCQTTTANPPLALKKWGVISATQLLANGSAPNATQLSNIQNFQMAVLANYGTGGILPQIGATMAGISTGRMRDANDAGYVAPINGTDLGVTSTPPAAYLAAHGGQLPPAMGCSGLCPSGTGAYDPANLRLQIRVPTNVNAFRYKYRFFSPDYANYSCTTFNDFHLALLTSNASGLPADKNIALDATGNRISVNSTSITHCVQQGCYICPNGSASLAGTGMDTVNGAGTQWLTVTAPVVPGEVITLELMMFDVGDGTFDTNLLLDGFEWLP